MNFWWRIFLPLNVDERDRANPSFTHLTQLKITKHDTLWLKDRLILASDGHSLAKNVFDLYILKNASELRCVCRRLSCRKIQLYIFRQYSHSAIELILCEIKQNFFMDASKLNILFILNISHLKIHYNEFFFTNVYIL